MHGDQSGPTEQTVANQRALARAQLERLDSDLRVLSPLGIERAAWGWDRHEGAGLQALHDAERVALHRIEQSREAQDWDAWRRRIFEEVEGHHALIAWRTEHGGRGRHGLHVHKAERAAFAAALALFAQSWVSHAHYATLVSAMAEALPWLLPEQPPSPST
jgi:hypothetical protein